MAFGVILVLLIVVSGWWLYSRWADVRDTRARRREAEMMFVFEAQKGSAKTDDAVPNARATAAGNAGEFHPTLPGDR